MQAQVTGSSLSTFKVNTKINGVFGGGSGSYRIHGVKRV